MPQLVLIAGNTGGPGLADGIAASARFNNPTGVAVDLDGTVYIADKGNNVIRKIVTGVVTTVAGITGTGGHSDGSSVTSRFNAPNAIAVDTLHNIFIADTGNRVIRKLASSGEVTTFAGTVGVEGGIDGQGVAAQFRNPVGIASDTDGNLYVVDKRYVPVPETSSIRKITPGGSVTTMTTNDNTFSVVSDGIAVDQSDNLYVIGVIGSDTSTHTVQSGLNGAPSIPPYTVTERTKKLLKISPQGEILTLGVVQTEGKYGGITLDSIGNVYFSNYAYHTIYRYSTETNGISVFAGAPGPVSYDSHGLPTLPASLGSADGTGTAAQFNNPTGLAADSGGNLYIADQLNHLVRRATPQGAVTTLAGAATRPGISDGSALEASFGNFLKGSAVDGVGNIYVSDSYAHTIRKITPEGVVTTLAGAAGESGYADGNGVAARFNFPNGITADPSGNVYVADNRNSVIRRIAPNGDVTTIAGTAGNPGHADGIGASAQFQSPTAITRDSLGNLYVTGSAGTIRKITPMGGVSTIAGSPDRNGVDSDGIGTAAKFKIPSGIAVDAAGTLYVTDMGSYTIRKISPTGQVTTLAGMQTAEGYVDGIGSAARFTYPTGIAVDSAGNLYVSDSGNSAIRKITSDGTVSTVTVMTLPYQIPPGERLQSISYGGSNTLLVTSQRAVLRLSLDTQ